jgi:hypothetical protein
MSSTIDFNTLGLVLVEPTILDDLIGVVFSKIRFIALGPGMISVEFMDSLLLF